MTFFGQHSKVLIPSFLFFLFSFTFLSDCSSQNTKKAKMNIPSDLKIEIVTGGLLPSINRSLIINAEGFCEYSKTEAGKIGKPPLEKKQFTLLESDLETIWKAVIGNDFFNLQETYINEEIKDGLFLIVFIQGDEKKHQVTIENEKVDAINSIISVIESLTPIKEKFIILLNKPGRSE